MLTRPAPNGAGRAFAVIGGENQIALPALKPSRMFLQPFLALQVLVFVLCILFPQIVTWLPGHMIG